MTEEQEVMLRDMHEFWHKPTVSGRPSRAVQLDRILELSRGTTFMGKALMMLFGLVVTVATTWAAMKTLFGIGV